MPTGSSRCAFTDRQFRDFAGRPRTATEVTSWRTGITNRSFTPSGALDSAVGFSNWSPKQSPIIGLYRAYFLRLPDTSGLDYWTERYRTGTTLRQISDFFARSAEFVRLYGSLTNRQFVERIYQNILGRPREPSGVAFWTGELDSGRRSRGTVMIGFSESAEYKRTTTALVDVVNVYTGPLRRVPTTDEHAFWERASPPAPPSRPRRQPPRLRRLPREVD